MTWWISVAYIIDLVVGDPRSIPHPVVIIGKIISGLEKLLRKYIAPVFGLKMAGVFLLLMVVGFTYGITFWAVKLLFSFNYWLGLIVTVWFLSTTLATKGLYQAGQEIFELLKQGKLAEARVKVGWIVGRDTANLSEEEITRATVETVSENIVDGISSPLFYAFLGGLPMAMAYKAVNTLDSMVGYKNEKYQDFGWASAKFDDIANYLPARITAVLIVVAAWLVGKNYKGAMQSILKDAKKHPSPNSGFSEAGVAGALNVRLGGVNYYGGKESFRAYMGDPLEALSLGKIKEANQMMVISSLLMLGLGVLIHIKLKGLQIW